MRVVALPMLVIGATLAIAPVSAQTYGSTYPVCMQVFGPNPSIDCSYSSIAQCRPLATARAAQCIANPYYAHGTLVRSRRHRNAY